MVNPMEVLLEGFKSLLSPVFSLALMIVMGVALVKFKALDDHAVDVLNRVTVYLLLPMLNFSNVVGGFRPGEPEFARWYILPLAALAMVGLGYGVGWLFHLMTSSKKPRNERITFATLCGWPNAGYIPIPIIAAIYAGATQERMLVYCFLFILGLSPTLWSLAPLSLMRTSAGEHRKLQWKRMITPPFIANVSAIALCLIGAPQSMPEGALDVILGPLRTVGNATIPVIMVSLGAMLTLPKEDGKKTSARFNLELIGAREILAPLAIMGLLAGAWAMWGGNEGYYSLLWIQSAVPPATGLTVIARRYASREESDRLNGAILWTYLAAAVLMPTWLALGRALLPFFVI